MDLLRSDGVFATPGLMVSLIRELTVLNFQNNSGFVSIAFCVDRNFAGDAGKSLVWAMASRNFAPSVVPARLIASNSTIAESYPRPPSASGTALNLAL